MKKMDKETKHYQYLMKCLSCGLHYVVLTCDMEWAVKRKPTCPECGEKGSSMALGLVASEKQIFEVVPGDIEANLLIPKGKEKTKTFSKLYWKK